MHVVAHPAWNRIMTFARPPRLAAALIGAALWLSGPTASLAAPIEAATPAASAGFKAGEMARRTATVSAGLRNHSDTTLRVLVWYPAPDAEVERPIGVGSPGKPVFMAGAVARDAPFADARRHPVVLLSHGFGGTARQMTWLGTSLARAGYVAVAVDHPGTNGIDGVTAQGAYAPWERAGDLVAALDLVLADPTLAPHLDRDRVGVAGFSMGGFTAALLVGARADFDQFVAFCQGPARDAICNKQVEFPLDYTHGEATLAAPDMADIRRREKGDWRDARVKAALLIDPALGPALDAPSLGRIRAPVLVIYGTADAIAPPPSNALRIGRAIAGASLMALPGVGHYDFLSECSDAARSRGLVYCTDGTGTTRRETHRRTADAARTFFDAALHVAK